MFLFFQAGREYDNRMRHKRVGRTGVGSALPPAMKWKVEFSAHRFSHTTAIPSRNMHKMYLYSHTLYDYLYYTPSFKYAWNVFFILRGFSVAFVTASRGNLVIIVFITALLRLSTRVLSLSKFICCFFIT